MIDEAQVRNIAKKVLKEEHLDNFIKIFEKEHNLIRGSHDKIGLPAALHIPERIITQIVEKFDTELTEGSIPFIGEDGHFAEDNDALFWDATAQILRVTGDTILDGAVVINESGEDKDFRVEGLNNTTLLNTDAANDYVGFLGTPSCNLHLNLAAASACFRVSANTQPWMQWEERDNNRGFAIGIPPSGNKLYIDYDSPIGTYQTIMMTFDAATNRIGIFDNTPSYPFDVTGNTRIVGTLAVTSAVTFGTTLGVTGDTTLSKLIVTGDGADAINLTSATGQIQFLGGAGIKGINYKDTGGDQRYAMMFPDASDVVHLLNRAANGTVEIHANTAVAGAEGDVLVAEFQDDIINLSVNLAIAKATLVDDGRGLSSIFTLSENPAKSDGIGFYSEGHIGAITTDGPTYGAGAWLNIDSGAVLGADVRALDIGVYERDADCRGGNAYGLAIHMDFDLTNPPAAIYPFRLNCEVSGATPTALIFAPNKEALGLVIGDPGTPDDAYLKIVLQDGSVYRIPLFKEQL